VTRSRLAATLVASVLLSTPVATSGQGRSPAGDGQTPGQPAGAKAEALAGIGIDQRLGQSVPLALRFRDDHDREVTLGQYFRDRPVVLALVYYECPMLCTLVLNGVLRAFRALDPTAGRDFELVVVSIDPGETPALAAAKKAGFLQAYQRPAAADGLHFLTGAEADIARLAEAVGFRYRYDPKQDQYAHAAGIYVVTPAGVLSRYLLGIEYAPRDLKLALVEASDGRIGSAVDQVLLYCYHFDPTAGKYDLAILAVLRLAGLATLLVLVTAIVIYLRRERRAASTAVSSRGV
jgi:protein SCO1/2